jgi:peptidoglycan/LPS O-acetylase OafA/YrhL
VATDPLLFEFFAGALIGALYFNGLALPRGIALVVLVLGIAGIFAARNVVDEGWVRVLLWGSASAAILLGAISLESAKWIAPPFAVTLGDSSYSLYLTHPFVLPVFGKVGLALGIATVLPPFVFGVVVFFAALTAGHITYHLIERPLTARLTKPFAGLPSLDDPVADLFPRSAAAAPNGFASTEDAMPGGDVLTSLNNLTQVGLG